MHIDHTVLGQSKGCAAYTSGLTTSIATSHRRLMLGSATRCVQDYLETHKVQQRIQNLIQELPAFWSCLHQPIISNCLAAWFRREFLLPCARLQLLISGLHSLLNRYNCGPCGRTCCEKLQMIPTSAWADVFAPDDFVVVCAVSARMQRPCVSWQCFLRPEAAESQNRFLCMYAA